MTFSSFSIRILASAVLFSSAFCAASIQAQEQRGAVPASPDVRQTPAVADEQQPAQPARVQKFDDWYYRCMGSEQEQSEIVR
ncbi:MULTISPECIES: hypothetical protein [unclassified Rhizobium]|uniref:hypothetical protein n=1 Tax=unclassified Rhizobium TaxID=2613769 RepID=UPI00167445F5|nr:MULTISPECIES: hypothetical protein [unclassified Rhizobium]